MRFRALQVSRGIHRQGAWRTRKQVFSGAGAWVFGTERRRRVVVGGYDPSRHEVGEAACAGKDGFGAGPGDTPPHRSEAWRLGSDDLRLAAERPLRRIGVPGWLFPSTVLGMAGGVRFVQSQVGAQIAYSTVGVGPPMIVIPPWMSHLEAATAISGYGQFYDVLAARHTVVRYDRWGTGLSDRDRSDFSLEAEVQVAVDLADHLRLRRFALMGPSHGGPVAVAVAHRAARRVSHLVLYGTGARVVIDEETWAPLRHLIMTNWPAATRAIGALATAGGDTGDVEAFAALMRAAATPEMTVALQDAASRFDVSEMLGAIRAPTLVIKRWGDPFVSSEAARRLAGSIPGARFELVEGDGIPYVGDAAELAGRIVAFTAGAERGRSAQLSAREAEVLALVAEGCTNAEIADRLVLSVRTVERHLLNSYAKLGVRGRAEAIARWLNQNATLRP
jgi:DNA-binding CsgD family transcriptional regulator/pimeloyl-ACP methyl ester carboxylesterase